MGVPLLSVTMPTRNRARLFERALGSVIGAAATVADDVEVTVSDGSDDDATGQVVEHGGLMANLVLQSFTYWSLR